MPELVSQRRGHLGPAEAVATQTEPLLRSLRTGFEIDGERIAVQASIGVALYPEDGDDEVGLLAAADRAMYARKFTGREPQPD